MRRVKTVHSSLSVINDKDHVRTGGGVSEKTSAAFFSVKATIRGLTYTDKLFECTLNICGGSGGLLQTFLNSLTDGVMGSDSYLCGTHCLEEWVNPVINLLSLGEK